MLLAWSREDVEVSPMVPSVRAPLSEGPRDEEWCGCRFIELEASLFAGGGVNEARGPPPERSSSWR